MYVCMCVSKYVNTHTIYIHTHTYIQTYIMNKKFLRAIWHVIGALTHVAFTLGALTLGALMRFVLTLGTLMPGALTLSALTLGALTGMDRLDYTYFSNRRQDIKHTFRSQSSFWMLLDQTTEFVLKFI